MNKLKEEFERFLVNKDLIKIKKKNKESLFGHVTKFIDENRFLLVNDMDENKTAIVDLNDIDFYKKIRRENGDSFNR